MTYTFSKNATMLEFCFRLNGKLFSKSYARIASTPHNYNIYRELRERERQNR